MPALLVLMFVLVPLAEIVVILQVGAAIGGWWTAGLLVADSLFGAWLLRVEGRRAWREFRGALEEGRWPGDEVAQGALVIVGGTLLLTPGFLTDVLGFLFLLGPTRRIVAGRLRARVGRGTLGGAGRVGGSGPVGGSGRADGAGRTAGSGRADGGRRSVRGEEVDLDIEVVEVHREQPDSEAPGTRDDPRDDAAAADEDPRAP